MCEHLLLFRASEAERATLAVVHDDEGVSQEDADDIDADEEELEFGFGGVGGVLMASGVLKLRRALMAAVAVTVVEVAVQTTAVPELTAAVAAVAVLV